MESIWQNNLVCTDSVLIRRLKFGAPYVNLSDPSPYEAYRINQMEYRYISETFWVWNTGHKGIRNIENLGIVTIPVEPPDFPFSDLCWRSAQGTELFDSLLSWWRIGKRKSEEDHKIRRKSYQEPLDTDSWYYGRYKAYGRDKTSDDYILSVGSSAWCTRTKSITLYTWDDGPTIIGKYETKQDMPMNQIPKDAFKAVWDAYRKYLKNS